MKHTKSSSTHHTPVIFGLFALAFAFISLVQVAATVPTTRVFPSATVLGDSAEEKMNEEQKKQEEQEREQEKKEEESKKEEQKKSEEKKEIKIQSNEIEVKTANGTSVKAKIEDNGSKKLEIEQGKKKIKVETRREEKESTPSAEVEVEDEFDDDTLQVATDSGNPSLTRNNIHAESQFPLSIDEETNTLMVTTPAGTKAVSVLPDQAVENLLGKGLISTVSASPSAQEERSRVALQVEEGKPVYKVQATKKYRLFGIFDVDTPTTVTVSAENGQILTQERSLLSGIIDLLSP